MPFDPTLPKEGSECDAAEMRAQLTGLQELIPASAQVDTTTTGPPGTAAAVSAYLSTGILHFHFTVPQGADGQPGPPGEVTQAQLSNDLVNCQNAAVSTVLPLTSANSNLVSTLGQTISNPPTQAEVVALQDKLNELIQALRR